MKAKGIQMQVRNSKGEGMSTVTLNEKQFSTGTDGFVRVFKAEVDGINYQFDVKAYRVHSKDENIAAGFVPTVKADVIEA